MTLRKADRCSSLTGGMGTNSSHTSTTFPVAVYKSRRSKQEETGKTKAYEGYHHRVCILSLLGFCYHNVFSVDIRYMVTKGSNKRARLSVRNWWACKSLYSAMEPIDMEKTPSLVPNNGRKERLYSQDSWGLTKHTKRSSCLPVWAAALWHGSELWCDLAARPHPCAYTRRHSHPSRSSPATPARPKFPTSSHKLGAPLECVRLHR